MKTFPMTHRSTIPALFSGFDPFSSIKDNTWEIQDGVATAYFDLPGVSKEDISINNKNGYISIQAKRTKGSSTWSYKFGTYVPDLASEIEAELKDGVLKLSTKLKEDTQNQILIK